MQELDDSRDGVDRAKQEARAEYLCFYSEQGAKLPHPCSRPLPASVQAMTRMAAPCKEEQRRAG